MEGLLQRLQAQRAAPARALGVVPQVFEEALRRVDVEIQIAALGLGTITDAWVEYKGNRVTEVPFGEVFDIRCSYQPGGGDRWLSCVTAAGGGIENYEDTLIYWANNTQLQQVKLDKRGANIMPDHDISLRFKLWGNEDENISPAYPPKNQW